MPGEDSAVRLQLVKQMVIEPNQQFTIRAGTSTIGTGLCERAQLAKEKAPQSFARDRGHCCQQPP